MNSATLHPNRISIIHRSNQSTYKYYSNKLDKEIAKKYGSICQTKLNIRSLENLNKKKSTYSLSKTSVKNILNSINTLFILSKSRVEKVNKSKSIYTYKASFVTLTLPAKQFHTDIKIKEHFSLFLNSIRNTLGIHNYVWKVELQKNQNIHFHLVIDKYVDYNVLKYYWNKQLLKLGYISVYKNKFSNMSLKEYSVYRNKKVEECKSSYIFGIKSGWQSPNTVSVNSIYSSKMLASYLAKYISKPALNSDNKNNNDIERIERFGRVWSRSQSLSQFPKLANYSVKNIMSNVKSIIKKSRLKKVKNDYVTTYYIYFSSLKSDLYKYWSNIFFEVGKSCSYPFPVPI